MRFIFLLIVFGLSKVILSQELTVYGTITNTEGDSLYMAKVIYGSGSHHFVRSDKNGAYVFKTKDLRGLEIIVNHTQHEKLTYRITERDLKQIESRRLMLNFTLRDHVLKTVEVGNKEPDVFFQSPIYSVADFEVNAKGETVLLTYPKKLPKGSDLKLLDSHQKVIDTYHFSGRAVELKTDYRKNIHLISEEDVYLVLVQNDKIHLLKVDRDYFFKYVSPILDTLDNQFYYSDYSEIYPAFSYYQFNKVDSSYTPLLSIIDEPMMEQYRAEFKFSDVRTRLWAANKEIESGIDKEIWVGAAIFSNSIYYEPLYAPLFVNKGNILVFDHYKSLLFKYNQDLSDVDSLSITYHEEARKSGWDQPLIQDKEQGNIYVLFKKNGYTYLSLVDLATGNIKYSRKLYYRYIEKLKIMNNQILYIYRPFETIQKKSIYRETINLE